MRLARFFTVAIVALGAGSCSLQDFGRFTFGDGGGDLGDMGPTETRRLAVILEGTGRGTVTADRVGIDCSEASSPDQCEEQYPLGVGVTLTATPDATSTFVGWSGDCTGDQSCLIQMSQDRLVRANFARASGTVTVTIAGDGAGTVVSNDGTTINCTTGTCTGTFTAGAVVTLTATATTGTFAGWSGHCAGSSTCTLTIDKDYMVGASFDNALRSLLVSRAGTGSGTVSSSPGGVSCGTDCAEGYNPGQMVTLTATVDPGSVFAGWSGDCAGTSPLCAVTLDAVRAVSATFNLIRYDLTVEAMGTGTGSVESFPAGIDCGATCTAAFDHGTMVTLVATADMGSTFEGWSGGGCSGTSTLCTVSMTMARTVFPTFTLDQHLLTVSPLGSGSGTVLSEPAGIVCGSDCTELFGYGTMVTLTAVPNSGSTFSGWSGGGCTGTDLTCTVSITQATTVTAGFAQGTHPVSVVMSGTGMGSVTADVGGINCGTTCMADVGAGTPVTFTAVPSGSDQFAGWGGACSGTSTTCTVTVNGPMTVSATFVPAGGSVLTVTKEGAGTGTVTSMPDGIDCGETCAASFPASTMVTLQALVGPGSTFDGWSGGGCTGTGDCTVTVSGAAMVTATFGLMNVDLTVATSGSGTGVVSSTPTGIDCGTDCDETLPFGTMVTLTAMASADSTFTGWSGGGCSGTGPCMATLAADTTITATFALRSYTVTINKGGTGTGAVTTDVSGLDCGADCTEDVQHGTMVTFTAVPDPSSTFTGWSGGGCMGTAPCTVTVTAATTVSASFALKTYLVTVTKSGSGTGSVTSAPSGIDCGADCGETYDHGTSVMLTASADASSNFAGWSGACSGTGACMVTVTQAQSVTATFTLRTYALTVSKNGTGTGTVTSAPGGVNCGTTCMASFSHGTMVTLTATPDASSMFTGWSGAGCTGAGTCDVTLTAAASVTATFAIRTYTLTVTKAGTGGGTVTSMPAMISCGATCAGTFNHGTMITLTATPDGSSTFSGWSGGGCSGTGTCMVTLTGVTGVTATFAPASRTLTVAKNGTGTGTVTSMPSGVSCGADCSETYPNGTMVTLTATPDASSTFTGWSGGGCTGTGTCMVTVTAATTVTATFTLRTWSLAVMRTGTGTGTVTSMPGGISCGADCGETYNHGTMVTLTPMAAGGSTFAGWGGACTGSGACTVTMDAAQSVTATFSLMTDILLTVSKSGAGDGTITSMPSGISCGATCAAGFTFNQMVTLTAVASTGSMFTGWSGAGCAGTGTCVVTMDMARNVTAAFSLNTYPLDVTPAGTGTGTVTSMPGGINCGADCTETYGHGSMVTLSAAPATSSDFTGWSGGGCSGTAPCTVSMTAARAVTATFTLKTYSLSVTKIGTGGGSVTSMPAGINCGATCAGTFNHGTLITLTAAADATSTFAGWSGGGCTGTGTCMVTLTAATMVTATFNIRTYTLTVTKIGNGNGTVTSSPVGINCGADCNEPYNHGTMVTLTAAESASSTFMGWSGACSGNTPTCMVTLTAAATATANFVLRTYTLTTTLAGNGNGSVTSMPTGINCGTGATTPDCSEAYDHGTMITLTANPNATNSTFAGWSGGGCTGTGTCTVTLTAATTVTATFNLRRYTLTINKTGSGTGTVSSADMGIVCGSDCSEMYDHGTVVSLSASAANGSFFGAWSGGGCLGNGSCVVTMTGATTVNASFLRNYNVNVGMIGDGIGWNEPYVFTDDGQLACDAFGNGCGPAIYAEGTVVTLNALAPPWAGLVDWGPGPCSGQVGSSCTFTVTATITIRPTFNRITNIVFATRRTYPSDLGGVAGADAVCQQAALDFNLPGTYLAWISTNLEPMSDRLAFWRPNGWILTDGQFVAADLFDLVDGVLLAPINVDEGGKPVISTPVAWTNTTVAGASASSSDCGDWSATLFGSGRIGQIGSAGPSWTNSSSTQSCISTAHLYCFGVDLDRVVF